MNMRWRLVGLITAMALPGITESARAQGGAQFQRWSTSALRDPVQAQPATACASLVALTTYDWSITAATLGAPVLNFSGTMKRSSLPAAGSWCAACSRR